MKIRFTGLLVAAAAMLLLVAPAEYADAAVQPQIVTAKAKRPAHRLSAKPSAKRQSARRQSAKRHSRGYGFLPGYRPQIPNSVPLYRSGTTRSAMTGGYEMRYWHNGQYLYGWGRPRFYRGRWNGGGFGPCWTITPIGMMWTCGR